MEQRRREPLRARRAEPAADSRPASSGDGTPVLAGDGYQPVRPRPAESVVGQPAPAPAWGGSPASSLQVASIHAPVHLSAPAATGLPWPSPSSPGRRLGAYLLDGVLAFVTLFIGWIVWSLVLWSKGQSPGKSLLGMRCMSTETGRAATWGTMALREVVGKSLLGSVSFGITTLVSCFLILGNSSQGIWDKISTTVVVDDPDGRLIG